MLCSTEQTFIDGHGEDSAVFNIAGPNRPSGVDYNPMKIDDDSMILLKEFLTPTQQTSSVMLQSIITSMEPLNPVESTAIGYEITDLKALDYDFIDPGDLYFAVDPAVDPVSINQDEVEVSVDHDSLKLSALDQNLVEVLNPDENLNMGDVIECESPTIIYFPSTDNIPYVDEGLQEMEVPVEILQKNPEQQGDVASTQEPQPVPRKRGRKPKGEPGAPRRRNRPKKVKLYEMNQFDNSEEERRRKNAINAKRHRRMAKDKMSKIENMLATVTKERDFLKKEVEKLQRNEKSLLMKLRNCRVVTVN